MITIKIPFDEFMKTVLATLQTDIHCDISVEAPEGETKRPFSMKYYENHGEEVEIMNYPDYIEFYIK